MARTNDVWETGVGGTYIQTIAPSGYDLLINGSNHYINFGTNVGSSGYGIRDSGGTMQFKNSGGSWTAFGAGGGGSPGGSQYDVQVNDGAGGFYGDSNFSYSGSTFYLDASDITIGNSASGALLYIIPGQINFGDPFGAVGGPAFFLDSGSGQIIYSYAGVNTTTFTAGLVDTLTDVRAYHYTGNTGTPTYTLLGGAGTSPTASMVGNDFHHEFSLTAGTIPTAGAVIATVTFDMSFNTTRSPVFSPMNERSATSGIYMIGTGVNTYDIIASSVLALQGGRDYKWSITMTE